MNQIDHISPVATKLIEVLQTHNINDLRVFNDLLALYKQVNPVKDGRPQINIPFPPADEDEQNTSPKQAMLEEYTRKVNILYRRYSFNAIALAEDLDVTDAAVHAWLRAEHTPLRNNRGRIDALLEAHDPV